MAAKNKHRKKPKATRNVVLQAEENDMENKNNSGEEEEDPAHGEGQHRASKDKEDFNLDEVLRLGGTQVRQKHVYFFINLSLSVVNTCLTTATLMCCS